MAQAAWCNKQWLLPPSSDLRPLAKTPRSHSQTGQWPNKQGWMQAIPRVQHTWVYNTNKTCMQSQSQHTHVYAIPQPLVGLQLMSDRRSNQPVFMQRPWGSARKQGNRQSDPRTSQCQGNDQTRTTNKQSRSGQQGSIFPLTG